MVIKHATTQEDINKLLINSDSLRPSPKFELVRPVGRSYEVIEDITDRVDMTGVEFRRQSYEPLGGSASISIAIDDSINLRKNLIRATLDIISDKLKLFIRRGMGVYLPKVPIFTIDTAISRSVECVDVLTLLTNNLRYNFSTQNNENARDAILRAFKSSETRVPYTINPINYSFTDQYGEVWLASDEIEWLEVINDMLRATGNTGLFSNRLGIVESRSYQFIDNARPIWKFSNSSGVAISSGIESNFWDIPNRWTGVADINNFVDPLIDSSYTISNLNDGETSFEAIGRWNDRTIRADVRTKQGLEDYTRWIAQLDRQISLRVNIDNYINPLFWFSDVVEVDLPDIRRGIHKGVVTSWSMRLDSELINLDVEIPI